MAKEGKTQKLKNRYRKLERRAGTNETKRMRVGLRELLLLSARARGKEINKACNMPCDMRE